MAKLTWEISRTGYGLQFEVVANTRADAIAKAEAKWLAETAWESDLVGRADEGGNVFSRSPIPEFKAKKLTGNHCFN